MHIYIYIEFINRKVAQMNLFAGQRWSRRHRKKTGGLSGGRREWGKLRE